MERILKITKVFLSFVIIIGVISCKDNSVAPKTIPHFPVIFKFVDMSDTTMMQFDVRGGVYFPKQDSSTYLYTGESAPYGHGKWLVGHVVVDSITGQTAVAVPYPGVEAGLMIIAQKFWNGDNGHNLPTWRAWLLKQRTINNPDSNVIFFTWPKDTLNPNVKYIGYVNPGM